MKQHILLSYKWILISCLMLGFTTKLRATHIIGGEYTYRYLYTVNNYVYYETKLILYRDCNNSFSFPNMATVGLYKSTNYASLGTRQVLMAGKPISFSPACGTSSACLEKAAYIDTLSMSINQSFGIIESFGTYYREYSVANFDFATTSNPDIRGTAFHVNIPSPQSCINSSPTFLSNPQELLITGHQIKMSNPVYDADGDSLVYSLVTPYSSKGGANSNGYPVDPPIGSVLCSWANGYSLSKPLGSKGFASINSVTGEMILKPKTSDYFTLAFQIDEYRTDSNNSVVHIGETRRDLMYVSKAISKYSPLLFSNYGGTTTKTFHAGMNNCFNISGIDSLGDSLSISAEGIMFDSVFGGQSALATFASKSGDSIVSQQFCWSPSCNQISDKPYILTVNLKNSNCNYSSKTFEIYVDTLKNDTINAAICIGNYYNFNGKLLDSAGTYTDTLYSGTCTQNAKVIITLNLNIDSPSINNLSATFCANHSYNFNGKWISSAGNYSDTLIGAAGCDSVLNLNLTMLPSSYDTITVGICPGFSYYFKGQNISKLGYYYDTLTHYTGCDSIIVLNLISGPYSYKFILDTICIGSTYNFNGNNISTAGNYVDTLKNNSGCDSIIALVLTVNSLSSLGSITGATNVYMHDTVIYSVPSNPTSYVWTVTGGTIISGQGTNAIKVLWDTAVTGSISVYANCYDTSNLNINITNAINPIGQQNDIRIYPNPSYGSFNIQFNNPITSKSEFSIYNSIGQKVYYVLVQSGTELQKVELANVNAGCYYIHIKSDDAVKVQRIVINK